MRVFHSPLDALRSYAHGKHAIALPVLADPEKQIYRAYGVHRGLRDAFAMFRPKSLGRVLEAYRNGLRPRLKDPIRDGMTGRPADFLIAADGKLLRMQRGRTFTDSLQPQALHGWLDDLKIGAG